MELRQVFDTGILQVAVEKATEKDIEAIGTALENLKREIYYDNASASRVLDADIAFHKAVILSADNVLIWQIAGYIDRLTIPSRVRTMQMIIDLNQKEEFIRLHERLLEIIRDRHPEDIVQAVKDHYQYWRRESADGKAAGEH
jgi:DNA-binding FadR family transcriptional regulator